MSPNTVVPAKMREFFETVEFVSGAGDGTNTFCIEQAVAYLAGEPITDAPTCACPVIRRGAIAVNDSWAWEHGRTRVEGVAERTRVLKPLALAQLGTRSTPEVEAARAMLARRFAVRIAAPFWLRKAGLTDHADAIAALVVTPETLAAVRDRCREAGSRADAATYAAAADATYAAAARTLLTQYVDVLIAMCDVTEANAAHVLANDETVVEPVNTQEEA